MKKIICLIILMFICSCATVSQENVKQANARYLKGMADLTENKVQDAYIKFQEALEFDPNNKEALYMIGIIYLMNYEDFPKAIDFFQRAVKVEPNYSEAHNNIGFAYEKIGKSGEAIEAYKKALSNLMYRTPEKAYNSLGRVYYRLGRYDEAIGAYKDALKRMPELYLSYYGLALCYNAKGKYGDASAAITKAIEIDPLYKGDKNKAISDLKQRKLKKKGDEEKDIGDYLEILKY